MIALEWLQDMLPPEPRAELVPGLIGTGEIVLITGAPKVGKSTVAAELAAAVSNGGSFAGRDVPEGVAVMIAPIRPDQARRRLQAADANPINTALGGGAAGLLGEDKLRELARSIREASPIPSLIILDPLASLAPAMDPTSAADMGRVVEALRRLLEAFPRAALAVVQAEASGQAASAGATVLAAAADVVIEVAGPRELRAIGSGIPEQRLELEEENPDAGATRRGSNRKE